MVISTNVQDNCVCAVLLVIFVSGHLEEEASSGSEVAAFSPFVGEIFEADSDVDGRS